MTAVGRIWKNTGKLADGREIIYFDESPGLGRADVRDQRTLPPMTAEPHSPESGLRWDRLVGEWVVIAAQRQGRTFLPPPEACPLDPSAPGRPTEIPAADYDVVVFENRFPSLRARAQAQTRPRGAWWPSAPPSAVARWCASRPITTPVSRS